MNCVHEASISEAQVLFEGELPVLLHGRAHDFVEAGVDDVQFGGTLDFFAILSLVAHDLKETHLRLLLVLLGHLAGRDVFKVLEPLEIGAGDTATIDQKIGSANDTLLDKDLLGSEGSGTVSTLENGLDLDLVGVAHMERLLDGSGDQVVSLLLHERGWVGELGLSSTGESLEGSVLGHVVLGFLDVEAGRIVDSGVVLDDGGDFTAVLLEELSSPVTDCAVALHDEGAVFDALGEANLIGEGLEAGQLADSVVDTETSGLVTAVNTTLSDELTGAATLSVDVLLTLDVHVGILDPGHDLLVGSHVRAETINSSADEALLDELHGVLAGDSLKFGLRKFTGVDLNTTLTTTKWNIGDSKLEGHKGSEGLDFLKINVVRVSGTTLARKLVCGVLGSVASHGLKSAIITTEGDVESNDGLAGLDQVKILLGDASLGGSGIVEHLDLFKETGLTVLVETGTSYGGGGG